MKKLLSRFFYVFFALLLFAPAVFAQSNRQEAFAVTNARIVTGGGSTIERGTVVIRNGLIEAVGENVRVPADARPFDGTGLTVYPGFIDANTNLGFPAPTPPRPVVPGAAAIPTAQAQTPTPTNSNYPNGLQPEIFAAEQIRAGDAQFETIRNSGFTTALTVSRDGVFNGQSALINLSGETVSEMLVRAPVAEHVTFRTLGATYPTSLMGTFSALRQMFLDAQRLQSVKKMYDSNPRGIRRPETDRSLEALFPVLNREMPIIFNANSENEILRVLDLTQEFNIKAIISGGQEAWKAADRLKRQDVPVILSLNFPKRTTVNQPEADPESLELLRLRAETPKGAARLAAAGVRLAFQTGGMQNLNDYFTNTARAVENGLPRAAAIRAMTLGAAEIFGVADRLGSIEKGKIANLVVSRGDILAKDKIITHVFVDGKLFEQKPPTRPTGGAPTGAFANVSGTWTLRIELSGQTIPATLTLAGQGRILSGSLASQFGTVPLREGEVLPDGFRFKATGEFAGRTEEITVDAKINGDQLTGTLTTTQGAVSFSGTRNP